MTTQEQCMELWKRYTGKEITLKQLIEALRKIETEGDVDEGYRNPYAD